VLSISGTGIGSDIAIGRAYILDHGYGESPEYLVEAEAVDAEVERFRQAIVDARASLARVRANLPEDSPSEIDAFIGAHLLMLEDPVITEEPARTIRSRRHNAEWALRDQADKLIEFFDHIEDPYLRSKKADIAQVIDRIQEALAVADGRRRGATDENLSERIVVTRDLTPADTVLMRHQRMSGFVTSLGGPISHTAILARSLRIPAVVGLHGSTQLIRHDDLLVIDSRNGVVLIDPDDLILDAYRKLQRRYVFLQRELERLRGKESVTTDGHRIDLLANIELPEDIDSARASGADGVGLYRTEFLFMNRREPPSEAEQFEAYSHVIKSVSGPVTIRTLDLGADKQVDGGRADSRAAINPALGLRAVRLCLADPKLFRPQLRAILRASVHGNVRMMIPMLSSLSELEQVLDLIRDVKRDLAREYIDFDPDVPMGGMIEVPAAAVAADLFARKLDFLSIGTNDLIQYTLAIDRVDDEVNYLYDPLHPSVLRLIHNVIRAGNECGIPVSMCGEMAGDVAYTRLLLGLGLNEFSMDPQSLLQVKEIIRSSNRTALTGQVSSILAAADPLRQRYLLEALNRVD
jgi:phosphotransferase system enzyme I (PtsI)